MSSKNSPARYPQTTLKASWPDGISTDGSPEANKWLIVLKQDFAKRDTEKNTGKNFAKRVANVTL